MINSEIHEFLNSGCLFSLEQDELGIGWGNCGSSERFSSLAHLHPQSSEVSIYAPDFFLDDPKPWWVFPYFKKVKRSDLLRALADFLPQQDFISQANWMPPDWELFQEAFSGLQNLFRAQILKKAVPIVFEKTQIEMNLFHRSYLLTQLLQNTRGVPVYLYGIWDVKEGILGATPELLFRQPSPELIQSVALAGTRLKENQSQSIPFIPFIDDPKEREEHQIVVDDIQSSLSTLGQVSVDQTRVLELTSLSHLLTCISVKINAPFTQMGSFELLSELVSRLHPTPALGAFPREEGQDWLRSYQERLDRMRFGAPFGWIQEGVVNQCVVGIRNIQWKNGMVFLGAGCGVIPASQLEKEWSEVLGKIRSVKRIFGWEGV